MYRLSTPETLSNSVYVCPPCVKKFLYRSKMNKSASRDKKSKQVQIFSIFVDLEIFLTLHIVLEKCVKIKTNGSYGIDSSGSSSCSTHKNTSFMTRLFYTIQNTIFHFHDSYLNRKIAHKLINLANLKLTL